VVTADAAHVAAVAQALGQSAALGCGCCAEYPEPRCACGKDSGDLNWSTCPTCGQWPESPARSTTLATVAVETLTPLIRAQVAAEIRALIADDDVDWDSSYWDQAVERAARIAEGTS
jgi:hypothetical protein